MFDSEEKRRVLVVDDIPSNISILNEILKSHYTIQVALDGERALELAARHPQPDIILLDVIMPGMDGYEVCKQLKNDRKTRDIPVIFITSMTENENETYGLQVGASDYLPKPVTPSIALIRIEHQLNLKRAKDLLENQKKLLEKLVQNRTRELLLTRDVTIQCIASLAETRDNETGHHIMRTRKFVKILAEELSKKEDFSRFMNEKRIDLISKSAPLHDIGKVGIPDRILLKPGKLTDEEFAIMKQHPKLGGDALWGAEKQLGSNSFLLYAREIAYTHHERWDGTGYPQGLEKRQIPLSGRIMAIADVYDALISKRIYKPSFSHSKAVSIIAESKGTHFDPTLVDCFLGVENKIRETALKLVDDDGMRESLKEGQRPLTIS